MPTGGRGRPRRQKREWRPRQEWKTKQEWRPKPAYRPWDSLPAPALVCIFKKLSVWDRFLGGPIVCKAWNEASKDPRCWESMLADGESPELHFIKGSYIHLYHTMDPLSRRGLRTFIERSGSSATTLYLPPFNDDVDKDDVLFLIAERCPKLKHLSLSNNFKLELESAFCLFHSCKDLELVDLGIAPKISPDILEQIGQSCPELRGLRYIGSTYGQRDASIIATNFPKLQLLNLQCGALDNAALLTILNGCTGLQYLDVTGCGGIDLNEEISERVNKIPEFRPDNTYDSDDFDLYDVDDDVDDEYFDYDDYTRYDHEDYEDYGDLFDEGYTDFANALFLMKLCGMHD